MVYNIILMNGYKEICDLRKPLVATVGLKSRANKRYVSSNVTSNVTPVALFYVHTSVA